MPKLKLDNFQMLYLQITLLSSPKMLENYKAKGFTREAKKSIKDLFEKVGISVKGGRVYVRDWMNWTEKTKAKYPKGNYAQSQKKTLPKVSK